LAIDWITGAKQLAQGFGPKSSRLGLGPGEAVAKPPPPGLAAGGEASRTGPSQATGRKQSPGCPVGAARPRQLKPGSTKTIGESCLHFTVGVPGEGFRSLS
jgi:hypothetical protein